MTKEEREKVIDALKISVPIHALTEEEFNDYIQTLNKAMDWLEQEPKTGHWIKYDKEYFTTKRLTPVTHSIRECSECHTEIADFCGEMRFCPNCGAKMVESQESEVGNEKDTSIFN